MEKIRPYSGHWEKLKYEEDLDKDILASGIVVNTDEC